MPRALEQGEAYFNQHPRHPPFEMGCFGADTDGCLGAAMLLLGHATDTPRYCEEALLPAYWWADIATDHVDFTCHETPKYSWQWIVQPYIRWTELVYAYYETGDPYLLETARFTADAFYRFFWTNRPHRSVGRDALACSGLLALYECTGESVYLRRAGEVLAEVRRSYDQPEYYWPGHQSGCGPNGVARYPSYDYIPMVQARLQVQYLAKDTWMCARGSRDAEWDFVRRMNEVFYEKEHSGWEKRAGSLSYMSLTALADAFPDESDKWIDRLIHWNTELELPDTHDGGKTHSWVTSALRFDSWAWGATWEDDALHLRPKTRLLEDPRAPKHATIATPRGDVEVEYAGGEVRWVAGPRVPMKVHDNPFE